LLSKVRALQTDRQTDATEDITTPHLYAYLFALIRERVSINKIIYKIFGATDKDSYGQISEYFGIPSVEQLITNRHDRFFNRYRCQDNYVCQALIM